MKIKIIFSMILLSACASNPKKITSADLSYENVINFFSKEKNEADVISRFGEPVSKVEDNEYYTLTYSEPELGFQRLSVNLETVGKNVKSYIWIPMEQDKENTLDGAKEHFKNMKFRQIVDKKRNSHSGSDTTNYIDDKLGITIFYNNTYKTVEAIAWSADVANRAPSVSK